MAGYGATSGPKLGGSKSRGPGLSLKSDMKVEKGKGKARKQARRKV